jgi:hypothetical protein
MRAFLEGVLAGLGIAFPVGAIAVLIVDLAMRRGFGRAFPAAMGAAPPEGPETWVDPQGYGFQVTVTVECQAG